MMIRQSKKRASTAFGMLAAGCAWMLQQTAVGESPADDRSPWGVASSFEWFEEYPRFNPLFKEAGATWFRYFPDWSQVQPAKADFGLADNTRGLVHHQLVHFEAVLRQLETGGKSRSHRLIGGG